MKATDDDDDDDNDDDNDDDDIPEKVFARPLLYLIFATDKEVMNLK